MADCPHQDVRFCPLYHAAHDPRFGDSSCDDGHLDEGGCAVSRGKDYASALGRMKAVDARLVAELEWAEDIERSKAQRARNMRLMGVQ